MVAVASNNSINIYFLGNAMNLKRKNPYTIIGIKRLNCVRCGKQAEYQWSICALDNAYLPICKKCDIGLNKLVLVYMRIGNAMGYLKRYAKAKGIDIVNKDWQNEQR